ncbi:hypothetical protein K470DRAFT_74048 [Piedraia hortae CBS 480.64]|uniref:Protein kinase domain-containing protein n=1 Tax=Piedraia hortae CBS 480.64 TaxID=1314780 RepID=A0A6A7BY79_9PEZI|nr:hypothetical protein K470DRAFT_74048 [Piedraia hortae CBS 480.64]
MNGKIFTHHRIEPGSLWTCREHRDVAIKIRVEDAPPSLERGIVKNLTGQSKHPGMAYIPVVLDEFELVGSTGTRHCIGTKIYGVSVKFALVEYGLQLTASAAKRLQHQVLQAVDCLYQHGIVHGDLYTGNVCWKTPGINNLTEKEFFELTYIESSYTGRKLPNSIISSMQP